MFDIARLRMGESEAEVLLDRLDLIHYHQRKGQGTGPSTAADPDALDYPDHPDPPAEPPAEPSE